MSRDSRSQSRLLQERELKFLELCPPFEVDPCWVIVPDANTRKRVTPVVQELGRRVIQIHPGFTYGSGANELTRKALREIPRLCSSLSKNDSRVLDLGCGSGVLALAVASLGFKSVVGMDISVSALREARCNANENGLKVKWVSRLDTEITYDLIIANLFGSLFFDYLPVFKKVLAPQGRIYCVGFDRNQAKELLPMYEKAGFKSRLITSENPDWMSIEWYR